MPVAHLVERRERRYRDRSFDRRLVAALDRALNHGRPPLHRRDAGVGDVELDGRVRGVDRPRPGRDDTLRLLCEDAHSRCLLVFDTIEYASKYTPIKMSSQVLS